MHEMQLISKGKIQDLNGIAPTYEKNQLIA